MTSFVFIIGILFSLNFATCEGTIFLPPEGDTFVVAPGTDVNISWTFNDTNLLGRQLLNQEGVSLADLYSNGDAVLTATGKKLGVDAAQPATLILKNVELRHNGTYKFEITLPGPLQTSSSVTVFVAVMPTVTTSCSSHFKVDEGGDVRCLCKAEDANPPGNVNVTWYKDDVQIGGTKKEENMLYLSNVDRTASGTYKYVAQSLTLKNETSIKVIVYFAPEVTSLMSSPTRAVLFKKVTISCEASGLPSPRYIIIHNDTRRNVTPEKIYTIDVVKYSDAGLYQCVAENRLGKSSKNYTLIVTSTDPVRTTTVVTPTSNFSKVAVPTANTCHQVVCGSVVVWHVVVAFLSGLIIGVLSCVVLTVYFRRRYRNRKSQSNPEQQATSKVDSIYQDLDLSKMNQEENYQYQSLRGEVNSCKSESDYTELNLARDVEENYQTLTST